MDLRMHRLIEMAAKKSRIRVKRVSERAAVFLECMMDSEEDIEIYVLISQGLDRSDGKVLRFRDLVPGLERYFYDDDEPRDSAEAL